MPVDHAQLAFFDRWLKGEANGATTALRLVAAVATARFPL